MAQRLIEMLHIFNLHPFYNSAVILSYKTILIQYYKAIPDIFVIYRSILIL